MEGVTTCACGCGDATTRVKQREGAYVAGQYRRFVRGHWRRTLTAARYAEAPKPADGERISVHRLRAERALGKPLPAGVVVHHADGTMDSTAPLVICPDEAYHRLLHVRMRIIQAGGDPDTDRICCDCGQVKPLTTGFHKDRTDSRGHYKRCKDCRCRRS